MSHRHRVAFLTSHPIQYQAPLFRVLARRPEVDLTVFFCSDQGARRYRDPGFATELAWDVPLLDGYRSVVLPNLNRRGGPGSFLGLVNARIVTELRHGRFDALIVHGWAHATSWLAFVAASVLGVPVIVRGESNGLREPAGWRRLMKRLALGWLFRRASAFLAIPTRCRVSVRPTPTQWFICVLRNATPRIGWRPGGGRSRTRCAR